MIGTGVGTEAPHFVIWSKLPHFGGILVSQGREDVPIRMIFGIGRDHASTLACEIRPGSATMGVMAMACLQRLGALLAVCSS